MSVMGFQKNVDRGSAGGVSSINFFWWDFFLNFAKPFTVCAMMYIRESDD